MIQINPQTNEPYLPVPYNNTNTTNTTNTKTTKIILTPPRSEKEKQEKDKAALVSILNHPRVYPYLARTPYPYSLDDAEGYLGEVLEKAGGLLSRMGDYTGIPTITTGGSIPGRGIENGKGNGLLDGCPFLCIREVHPPPSQQAGKTGENPEKEGAEDTLIGNISIWRWRFHDLPPDSEESESAQKRNNELEVGDERIIWEIGDFLSPSHHGQGIMTAVIHTLIHDWAIPYMNAHTIKASLYAENKGSARVFGKNGFRLEHTREDWVIVPENRGGGRKSIRVFVWNREENHD